MRMEQAGRDFGLLAHSPQLSARAGPVVLDAGLSTAPARANSCNCAQGRQKHLLLERAIAFPLTAEIQRLAPYEPMTSIEIPYSIAAALPSLSVFDITNEVQQALAASEQESGLALLSPRGERTFVRVNERESGIFEDFEALLDRLIPGEQGEREMLLGLLLGARSEQVPFFARRLRLGEWQRVFLLSFDGGYEVSWRLTVVGGGESERRPES
jgi:thiamine phosphate synthase YjbQ (UPF0047 family)